MSVTELKKANGEVLKIIDGQYVIGANSGCFSDVACQKIISGEYIVTDCLDCITLESLDCFVNITSVEQFYNTFNNSYLVATSDNVNIIDTFNFFDEAEINKNMILDSDNILFTKINCYVKLKSSKIVNSYSLNNGTTYSDLIENNNIYMFGHFLVITEVDGLVLNTKGHIVTSNNNIENNSVMHKIEINYGAFALSATCKPILPGEYYVHVNNIIEIAFKNSTDKTLYVF